MIAKTAETQVQATKDCDMSDAEPQNLSGDAAGNERGDDQIDRDGVPAGRLRWGRRFATRRQVIAIGSLLLASVSAAAGLYIGVYRSDRGTVAASTAVIDAASRGSVALLSYAPDSLDHDLAVARSHLAGEFLTYYSQFADQFVMPASKEKDIHATASVVRAAIVSVHPGTAEVLVFLNQASTSRDRPEPAQAASSVKVGLTKVDDEWRISSFDPL